MSPMQKVAYHIVNGASTMYTVDAENAVQRFPDEWSWKPWSEEDGRKARTLLEQRHKEETEAARASGQPAPPPLPPPLPELTDAAKATIAADHKARMEAAEIVKKHDEEEAKRKAEADKIASARALLESAPAVVEQNERRPFGRKGEMTPKEREAAERRRTAEASSHDPGTGRHDKPISERLTIGDKGKPT